MLVYEDCLTYIFINYQVMTVLETLFCKVISWDRRQIRYQIKIEKEEKDKSDNKSLDRWENYS